MNKAISSSDPQAIEKLQEKIETMEQRQTFMKKVNAHYRKYGTSQGCEGVSDALAAKLDEAAQSGYSWEKTPFPKYELTNNSAEIRRAKKRLEELSQDREVGFQGWEFEGGTAEINTELNRLQFFFEEKPDEATRKDLQSSGFHCSPARGRGSACSTTTPSAPPTTFPQSGPNPGSGPATYSPSPPRGRSVSQSGDTLHI